MPENKRYIEIKSVATEYEVDVRLDGTKVLSFEEPDGGLPLAEILSTLLFEGGPTDFTKVKVSFIGQGYDEDIRTANSEILVSWEFE